MVSRITPEHSETQPPRPASRWIRGVCLAVMLLGALLPGPARCEGAPPLVTDITVEILDAAGPTDRIAAFARGLILLREGEPFSGEALEQSLALLKSSRLFRAIEVPDPAPAPQDLALTFRLTPFRRIKDIAVHGAFPLFEKEVLNAMTLFIGDAYVAEKLTQQEALIKEAFDKEGYPDARVSVTSQQDPEDGQFDLNVTIDKGEFIRIHRVTIQGNRSFSDIRLKLRIDSWKASLFYGEIPRFIEKKIEADALNLTRFYRNKGYADVEITPEVSRIPGTHEVDVRFRVSEGAPYKIRFEGNKEFWDYTLKKELVLAAEGNRHGLGLKKSIRNIRNRYRQAGYLDARVRMTETGGGPGERGILLTLDEGPRYLVRAITIRGNTVFAHERLEKQMLTRAAGGFAKGEFVPEVLEDDISAIQTLYLRRGYLDATVTQEIAWTEDAEKDQKLADVVLTVEEGPQTRVSSVTFSGLGNLSDTEARAAVALKAGQPYREYMLESDENTLSELISEKGFPHVTVGGTARIHQAGDGTNRAAVTYGVDEGPHVKTGEIFYTGNFRTRERILRREVELTPGAPFSLIDAMETQRNIRNIGALSTAHFRALGLKEKAPEVNLLVEVEEKKPYYLEVGAGYDTRRKKYANTRLGDHNLFGQNRDGWITAETSEIGHRAELGITEPRFLGTRVAATFSMFGEDLHEFNKEFGTRTYGTSLGFNRRFLDTFTAALTSRYEHRNQYRVGPTPIPPEEAQQYEPRSIVVTTPQLTYNTTDSFVRPRRGVTALGAVDLSQGIENSLDDFFKHRYELRCYTTPLPRLTFAFRGRIHHIVPYGSNEEIPEDQLLFLGGASDIRGFSENKLLYDADGNPVGGRTSIIGSVEARFDLGLNVEFTTFYDTGCVRKASVTNLSESFRSSAGAGLRYLTPIGPVGFLYGWKLDRREGESAGNIHLSIGYTF